jgi:hypothetical protein
MQILAEWLQPSPTVFGVVVALITLGVVLVNQGAFAGARICFVLAAVLIGIVAFKGIFGSMKLPSGASTLSLAIIVEVGIAMCLIGVLAWTKKQEPNLTAEILCPVGFSFDRATLLAIELTISNAGAPSTVHGLRAAVASADGDKKTWGSSFRVDASFAVENLPPEFGRRREFPLSSWLEGTVGKTPIGRHSTSLPGFFVARFDEQQFLALREELSNCRLEVSFRDIRGRMCPPAIYSRADEKGDLLIGFGSRKPIV